MAWQRFINTEWLVFGENRSSRWQIMLNKMLG